MKTSNKILLALMVIVFTVPLLLATTLKSKLKNGEFTVVKDETNNPIGKIRSGSFGAFKVVKVVGLNADFFTCHLKLSGNRDYKYYQQGLADSIVVFTGNDTLYIKQMPLFTSTQKDRTVYNQATIHVNLPYLNNLVADGAVVVIDSLPASLNNLSVTLRNRGQIVDGTEQVERESAKTSLPSNLKQTLPQAIETAEANVSSSDDDSKMKSFAKGNLALPDLNFRDVLIYRLLYSL